MSALQGVIPVVSMPFRDDESVDLDALAAQVEFLLAAGADGVALGLASEVLRLTDAERDAALAAVAGAAAGRVPVVASVGAGSTHAACARAEAALAHGADALMITPPAAPVAALFDHYTAIAHRCGVPIVVQDAPGMIGVEMPAELLVELATQIEHVVAVKIEADPPAPKISAVAERVGDRCAVLGGAGGVDFARELARGAAGTLPGSGLPELFVRVWRLYRDGEAAAAVELFERHLPLLTLAARAPDLFVFVQKELLRRRGVLPSARLRRPFQTPDHDFVRELDAALAGLETGATSERGAPWSVPG
jgi:2-keto-3-deoxy-L-arabinonate dehydratase